MHVAENVYEVKIDEGSVAGKQDDQGTPAEQMQTMPENCTNQHLENC